MSTGPGRQTRPLARYFTVYRPVYIQPPDCRQRRPLPFSAPAPGARIVRPHPAFGSARRRAFRMYAAFRLRLRLRPCALRRRRPPVFHSAAVLRGKPFAHRRRRAVHCPAQRFVRHSRPGRAVSVPFRNGRAHTPALPLLPGGRRVVKQERNQQLGIPRLHRRVPVPRRPFFCRFRHRFPHGRGFQFRHGFPRGRGFRLRRRLCRRGNRLDCTLFRSVRPRRYDGGRRSRIAGLFPFNASFRLNRAQPAAVRLPNRLGPRRRFRLHTSRPVGSRTPYILRRRSPPGLCRSGSVRTFRTPLRLYRRSVLRRRFTL